MLTLTQFSRKADFDVRRVYDLAKLLPLPPIIDPAPPKAGAKKFYNESDLQSWYEKATAIKNNQL